MKRKMQICGPKCKCGAFGHLLGILKSHGIEPAIKNPYPPMPDEDEDSKIVLFETPLNWTIKQLRELNISIWNNDFGLLATRPPCYVCLTRDWHSSKQLICSFCDDYFPICKECWTNFSMVRDYFEETPELRCHDCKEHEPLDVDSCPSLVVLVWKQVREQSGITADEIKAKISQTCHFDRDASEKIDGAIFDCIGEHLISHKNGKLYSVLDETGLAEGEPC